MISSGTRRRYLDEVIMKMTFLVESSSAVDIVSNKLLSKESGKGFQNSVDNSFHYIA